MVVGINANHRIAVLHGNVNACRRVADAAVRRFKMSFGVVAAVFFVNVIDGSDGKIVSTYTIFGSVSEIPYQICPRFMAGRSQDIGILVEYRFKTEGISNNCGSRDPGCAGIFGTRTAGIRGIVCRICGISQCGAQEKR